MAEVGRGPWFKGRREQVWVRSPGEHLLSREAASTRGVCWLLG